jgi:hypothetical protein
MAENRAEAEMAEETTPVGQADTEGQMEESGRTRVRTHFVRRLAEAGIKPPRGTTQAQHDASMDRLVQHLAYMKAEVLDVLAEQVLAALAEHNSPHCVSEIVIRSWAQTLQRRPFEKWRIVTSWLASIEGPIARDGGYLTELYRWLRGQPYERPPQKHDMREIMAEGEENRRTVNVILSKAARGHSDAADNRWLLAYRIDEAEALQIVADGEAARAEKRGAAA